MAVCETCGNDDPATFTIRTPHGTEHTFDSFECAAHVLAAVCDHCGCRILGHGIAVERETFCCAACARHAGLESVPELAVAPIDPSGEAEAMRRAVAAMAEPTD